tara:strand:- start:279 stop:518 length:240 start_codon:yes stop_codon:yes gene_type:complete
MAYQSKTGLKVNISKQGGQETIEFIEFDCKYQDTYIQYITQYYNPITGLYDDTKTMIYFEGNDTLLINQNYNTTSSELT